jgi:hypothetical protein
VVTKPLDLRFESIEQADKKTYIQIKTGDDAIFVLKSSSALDVSFQRSEIVSFIIFALPLASGKKQLYFELYQDQRCIASTSHTVQIATLQKQRRASLELLLNSLAKSFSADRPEDADTTLTETATELPSSIALSPLSTISEPLQDSTLKEVLGLFPNAGKFSEVPIQDKKNLSIMRMENRAAGYLLSTGSAAFAEESQGERSQASTSPAYLDLFQQSLQEVQQNLLPELCAVTRMAVASSYEAQIAAIVDSLQQTVLEQDDFAWIRAIQKLQVLKDRLLTAIAREKLQRSTQ